MKSGVLAGRTAVPNVYTLRTAMTSLLEDVQVPGIGNDFSVLTGLKCARSHCASISGGKFYYMEGSPSALVPQSSLRFMEDYTGRHLSTFENAKHFLQVVTQVIGAHRDAFHLCSHLHRDISDNNITMNEFGQGILSDWDLSKRFSALVNEDCKQVIRCSYRVGTWPFMSSALLKNPDKLHTLQDDLESFFHLILYYSLQYLPHDKPELLVETIMVLVFHTREPKLLTRTGTGGYGKEDVILYRRLLRVLTLTDNTPLTTWIRSALEALGSFYFYVWVAHHDYLSKNPRFNNLPTIFPLDSDKLASHDYFLELCMTALSVPDTEWPDNRRDEMFVPLASCRYHL